MRPAWRGVLSYLIWLADSKYHLRFAVNWVVSEITNKKFRTIVFCSKFFLMKWSPKIGEKISAALNGAIRGMGMACRGDSCSATMRDYGKSDATWPISRGNKTTSSRSILSDNVDEFFWRRRIRLKKNVARFRMSAYPSIDLNIPPKSSSSCL